MTIREGDRAPGFTLPSGPGREVDVGEGLGTEPVVLLFFPLAFSPVCTTEMDTFTRRWDEFGELGVRVYALSVDSPFVTEKFREEKGLPFPVLSDFNREVAARYGVLHEDLMGLEGVAKRSVFVVDGNGVVVFRWISDDPGVQPPYDEVKAAVEGA